MICCHLVSSAPQNTQNSEAVEQIKKTEISPPTIAMKQEMDISDAIKPEAEIFSNLTLELCRMLM